MPQPDVTAFFHAASHTFSYVVADPATRRAAVIDAVLDYDAASGRSGHPSADALVAFVQAQGLAVDWIIETHVHADHLSAAPYVQAQLGGRIGIGEHVRAVQATFGELFNAGAGFARDGSQFDHLFADGERYLVGGIEAQALRLTDIRMAELEIMLEDAALSAAAPA